MNRPQQGFPPILDRRGPPRVRRFDEQRWLIDNIIRANRSEERRVGKEC